MNIAALPHLLRLFDDASAVVRDTALGALAEFGDTLDHELDGLEAPPDGAQRLAIRSAVEEFRSRVRKFHRDEAVATLISTPLFAPGDVVRHRRYGYRGVIVAADPTCKAEDSWYESNQTRPERSQPWYHVLVDASPAVTYAAQTSLTRDATGDEVQHGLLAHFFDDFRDGRYERNGLPWPDVQQG